MVVYWKDSKSMARGRISLFRGGLMYLFEYYQMSIVFRITATALEK